MSDVHRRRLLRHDVAVAEQHLDRWLPRVVEAEQLLHAVPAVTVAPGR